MEGTLGVDTSMLGQPTLSKTFLFVNSWDVLLYLLTVICCASDGLKVENGILYVA